MADMLKITTPLVNKNQIQLNKQIDPSTPFNLQDITKVIKPNAQTELLKQNNGLLEQQDAPTLLMSLLKDPSVTVSFLKNIFMLQEIIKLLPANNQTMTQEIEQLFNSLLIQPDDIVAEMVKQENTSTAFKGDLFNFLRELVANNPQAELRSGVANLLKSINSLTSKQDILNAVANSLKFLSESLQSSKTLSQRLRELSARFRTEDAAYQFNELKGEVLSVLKDVENSLLFSSKMSKVVAITIYNLSRFNSNPDFFQEAVSNLMMLIDGKNQKTEFANQLKDFLAALKDPANQNEKSRIMDVLTRIIGKQSDEASINLLTSEKIEKIIHSLLSSPCNFTPLLHFVIPVQFMDMKSFAEIWINPNETEEGDTGKEGTKNKIHMLIVFDIEGIGQFEAELYVMDQSIDLQLFCPPDYLKEFSDISSQFVKSIAGSRYRFEHIKIDGLERPRSLMDTFKFLPYKRTGVDVKV
ncbi:antitoxin [Oscillospiraceae bacterium PP1C4]